MNDATPLAGELFVTQFLVVSDQDRSRDFYQSVFGADVVRDRDPVILALANTRIVLNAGDTPTDDKPAVRLAPPADPDISSGFLNLRVPDIAKADRDWSARGATFLTGPKDHGYEIRAYILCSAPQRPARQARAARLPAAAASTVSTLCAAGIRSLRVTWFVPFSMLRLRCPVMLRLAGLGSGWGRTRRAQVHQRRLAAVMSAPQYLLAPPGAR